MNNLVLLICLAIIVIVYAYMYFSSKKLLSTDVNLQNYEKVTFGKSLFYVSVGMIILSVVIIIGGIASNTINNIIVGAMLTIAFIFQALNAKQNMYLYLGKENFYYMGEYFRYKSIKEAKAPKGFFSKKYKCTTYSGESFSLPVAVVEQIKPHLGKNVIKA